MLINLLRRIGVYKFYDNYLKNQIGKSEPPVHIALILDGNRRWAKSKFIPEWMGHFAGADIVDDLLDWCVELDIKIITLYALSAENLSRPQPELERLFEIISKKLSELLDEPKIDRYRVHVKGIGNLSLLPNEIQEPITVTGSASGVWNTEDCVKSGVAAGLKAAQSLGVKTINYSFPKPGGWTNPISPLYEVSYNKNYSKSFIDFQHDVENQYFH